MSEEKNVYSIKTTLKANSGSTAAALDLIGRIASGSDQSSFHKIDVLNWVNEGDNLKILRDKIKECAGNESEE